MGEETHSGKLLQARGPALHVLIYHQVLFPAALGGGNSQLETRSGLRRMVKVAICFQFSQVLLSL